MEKITNLIADKIAIELQLDKDKKAAIAYGTFAIMHMTLSIILVVIFGLIFHVMFEALIISFTGSILRKYSGGAHASSPGMCAAIGTTICIAQALLIRLLIYPIINSDLLLVLMLLTFVWSYYLILKLAPVDSPAKPIKKQEKRQRMKKGSSLVLSIYLIIVIINFTMYFFFREKKYAVYSLCICIGSVWQSFTLTNAGHITISKLETFLSKIIKIQERRF